MQTVKKKKPSPGKIKNGVKKERERTVERIKTISSRIGPGDPPDNLV